METPAASTRNVGWKIDTGVSRSSSAMPWPIGVDQHGEGDHGGHQQHQGRQPVGHQGDAQRLRPGTDPHHLRAVAVGLTAAGRRDRDDRASTGVLTARWSPRAAAEIRASAGAEQRAGSPAAAPGASCVARLPRAARARRPRRRRLGPGRGCRRPRRPRRGRRIAASSDVVLDVVVAGELPAAVGHGEQERGGGELMTIAVRTSACGSGSLIVGRVGSPTIGARPARPPEIRNSRFTPLPSSTSRPAPG